MREGRFSLQGATLAFVFAFCLPAASFWAQQAPTAPSTQAQPTQAPPAPAQPTQQPQAPSTPPTAASPTQAPPTQTQPTGQPQAPTTPATQTPPAPASPAQPPPVPITDPASSETQPAKPVLNNDRLFFALPNLLTVENASSMPPLTTKQKFKAEAEGTFDPVEIVFVGIQAGIGQADNDNPTYGQGFIGYSKRFGTAYADTLIASFNTGAIWPSILRQDPRYYQLGKGNAFYRIAYSATRVVVSRSDKTGNHEINFSEFIGNGIAAVASNAYHPGPHTIVGTANVFYTQMAVDVLSNELKEFWPDLRRAITHKHNR